MLFLILEVNQVWSQHPYFRVITTISVPQMGDVPTDPRSVDGPVQRREGGCSCVSSLAALWESFSGS